MKILGRNSIRLFLATYSIIHCRRKHNLSINTVDGSVSDLYISLITSLVAEKYILVCYDVFSKHVNLNPLKAAKPKTCLKKLINNNFVEVIPVLCK